MAELVYALCALTSLACAALLARAYRQSGTTLLMWSALCFLGLGINNAMLFAQSVVGPSAMDTYRGLAGLAGVRCLLYGLVVEST